MSDHGPTNADIMRRLDDIAAKHDKHEKRIMALEADRQLVHNLHARVGEMAEKVTVIRELLEGNEKQVTDALRQAARSIADDVLAGVRSEMSTVRADVRQLRKSVEARPCLARQDATCPEGL